MKDFNIEEDEELNKKIDAFIQEIIIDTITKSVLDEKTTEYKVSAFLAGKIVIDAFAKALSDYLGDEENE